MRRKTILFMFNFVLFALLMSCDDVNSPTDEQKVDKQSVDVISKFFGTITSAQDDEYLGILQVRCVKYVAGNSNRYYTLSADIYEELSSNKLADVGKVTMSDYEIANPDSNNYYFYDFPENSSNNPTFGASGNYAIEGNIALNIPSFDTTMYVPEVLTITNTIANNELNRNQDLILQWNQDTESNNDCYLVLNYSPMLSKENNSSMPDTVIFWSKKIPDTGNYTLSSGIIQQFPDASVIELFLVRGNGMVVNKNDTKFLLIGYSAVWLILDVID